MAGVGGEVENRQRGSSFDCEVRVSTARFEFRLRVSSFDGEFRVSTAGVELRLEV